MVHVGEKIHKLAVRLREINTEDELFLSLIAEPSAEKIVLNNKRSIKSLDNIPAFLKDPAPQFGVSDFASMMMYSTK